jgi:hypothetical protein
MVPVPGRVPGSPHPEMPEFGVHPIICGELGDIRAVKIIRGIKGKDNDFLVGEKLGALFHQTKKRQ